jgi:hypothetical protein
MSAADLTQEWVPLWKPNESVGFTFKYFNLVESDWGTDTFALYHALVSEKVKTADHSGVH